MVKPAFLARAHECNRDQKYCRDLDTRHAELDDRHQELILSCRTNLLRYARCESTSIELLELHSIAKYLAQIIQSALVLRGNQYINRYTIDLFRSGTQNITIKDFFSLCPSTLAHHIPLELCRSRDICSRCWFGEELINSLS